MVQNKQKQTVQMLDFKLLQTQIDKNQKKAVYIQIADNIIELIKNGRLKTGELIPGTRQVAAELSINRNTVVQAFDVLSAEGWIISKERKRTHVSDKIRISPVIERKRQVKQPIEAGRQRPVFFDDGLPNTSCAPMEELARAYRRIFNSKARWQIMNLASEFGDDRFRDMISNMLNQNRGMNTSLPEICITRGSQMALFLTAHCLLKKDDIILVENPGFKPAWKTFEHAGARILPVPVDDEGINVEEVESFIKRENVKAVYLTPHHQYPTTVTLSLARRLRLIELSNLYGFTIIEDDYDNVFHFSQRPIMPISSYDTISKNNYIYIGTLSKLIAPAIRVGYIVASSDFIERVGQLRKIIDIQGDAIMEQSIMELIADGAIRRHQKRMLSYYEQKRDFFVSLLDNYLGSKVTYKIPDGGLAFWVKPIENIDLFQVQKKTNLKSISFYTPDRFSFDEPISGIRLGYASLSESDLEKGIKVLNKVL